MKGNLPSGNPRAAVFLDVESLFVHMNFESVRAAHGTGARAEDLVSPENATWLANSSASWRIDQRVRASAVVRFHRWLDTHFNLNARHLALGDATQKSHKFWEVLGRDFGWTMTVVPSDRNAADNALIESVRAVVASASATCAIVAAHDTGLLLGAYTALKGPDGPSMEAGAVVAWKLKPRSQPKLLAAVETYGFSLTLIEILRSSFNAEKDSGKPEWPFSAQEKALTKKLAQTGSKALKARERRRREALEARFGDMGAASTYITERLQATHTSQDLHEETLVLQAALERIQQSVDAPDEFVQGARVSLVNTFESRRAALAPGAVEGPRPPAKGPARNGSIAGPPELNGSRLAWSSQSW